MCPSGPMPRRIKIEAGKLSRGEMEKIFQGLLVLQSRRCRIFFLGVNAKNIFRRHWDLRQQRFVDHAVIALRMIGRDVALVTPEKINLVPRDVGLGGQQGIEPSSGLSRRRERP